MQKQSLLIIGAGAAGLMAATELCKDFDITILEAQPRIGGRIHSILMNEHIIEAGAEFIHGNLPVTLNLLKEAGINYTAVEGKMYRKANGLLKEQDEMGIGWEELLQQMKAVKEDMTMHEFLETYYQGQGNAMFRNYITAYTEGFDIADPMHVSIKSLYKEWNAGNEENYRIPEGYSELMKYLHKRAEENGAVILTGKKAIKVTWNKNNVTVYTQDGQKFTSHKLLVTVPLSILQQSSASTSISFTPSIDEYVGAAREIGYGFVIKAILIFQESFWEEDAGFFFSDENFFPTWWTNSPSKAPILTGWCGGPKAKLLSGEPANKILNKALASLAAIFDLPVGKLKKELVRAEVFNWQKDEFALGGYSYDTVHSLPAKKVLNTPISNTIFFAGEGLYNGKHPGTVEAAFESGKFAAKSILNG